MVKLLSDDQLRLAWDAAITLVRDRTIPRGTDDKLHLARCWEECILLALKKAGYVCVKSGD